MRVHRTCCAIDVHKKGIAVCVIGETGVPALPWWQIGLYTVGMRLQH